MEREEMTREQTIEAAKVMLGFADGKEVEFAFRKQQNPRWLPMITDWEKNFDWNVYTYRIKPTPVLRPWTADEVPLGAWMRSRDNPQDRMLIHWVNSQCDRELWLTKSEHSTDGGKTWLPCGVLEEAK